MTLAVKCFRGFVSEIKSAAADMECMLEQQPPAWAEATAAYSAMVAAGMGCQEAAGELAATFECISSLEKSTRKLTPRG